MATKCAICGKKIGIFGGGVSIKDATLCSSCVNGRGVRDAARDALDAGVSPMEIGSMFMEASLDDLDNTKHELQLLTERIKVFAPTFSVENFAFFDDNHKILKITDDVTKTATKHFSFIPYQDIIDYELLEDGASVIKGGLGRAVAGGLLFGPTGAIVGGVTRASTKMCHSMQIKLTLNYSNQPMHVLTLISTDTKTKSSTYKTYATAAQQIISKLQVIEAEPHGEELQVNQEQLPPAEKLDSFEELRKYKTLFDEGVITEDEFAAKKRQILDI